ncbi:AraC family transcriptional regulator [Williamsia deligens]|uniref:Helix-turn-helix domain-containing protein n=1 Tax=Williamsia deligens TaxID=321325 RepID=A0ABW3G4B7_9NOCA|nr:helix-turn-helix domain-containing protein [Williamsia deligens]MCP2193934.1 AraC-type DNA-binding protein [Williamsia deligens]
MGPSEIRRAVASRGHLNPGSPHVVFDRFDLGLDHLARQVWVVRWDVPRPLVQRVLNYPALNVVTEAGPQVEGTHHTGLYGPQPRVSTRTLTGRGWAVGVLFRPAATPVLTDLVDDGLVGADIVFADSPAEDLVAAMTTDAAREDLRRILVGWLAPLADRVDDAGLLANSAASLAEDRDDITTATALADAVHASPRTLERTVRRHTGFTPKQLIECRRMQYAATRLYSDPTTDLSALAADLGFADHAHLSRRYRAIIGETPSATREAGRSTR